MANEFEVAVMQELSEIKSLATAAASAAEAANKAAVASSQALNERLFNHGSGVIPTIQRDIQDIKDDRKSEARWERIHNIAHYSLTPLLGVAHAIARHFGVDI